MKQLLKFTLFLPMLLNGQNYKDDLNEVLRATGSLKDYSVRIQYRLYLDGNLNKAFQESSTQIQKGGTNIFYQESNGQEFISNNEYEVYLDRNTRSITAKRKLKPTQNTEVTSLSSITKNLDTLLSSYERIQVLKNEKNTVVYKLQLKKNQAIRDIVVYMNREKKMITKVQYTYNEKTSIRELKNTKHATTFEITYQDLKVGDKVNTTAFDEKKYLAFVNGKLRPASKYKDYKLIVLN